METFVLVTPDGELADHPDADAVEPDLCRGLHRDMALARRLDEQAYHLQRQGELGLRLQSVGQEAAQVAPHVTSSSPSTPPSRPSSGSGRTTPSQGYG